MLLNPFFEPYESPEDEFECYEEEDNVGVEGNQKYLDILKQKVDDLALFYDKYFQ